MKPSDRQRLPVHRPRAYCRLGASLRGEVIDLVAYRLAERVFWWRAFHGEDVVFEDVYRQVAAVLAPPVARCQTLETAPR